MTAGKSMFTAGLVQMRASLSPQTNLDTAIQLIEQAASQDRRNVDRSGLKKDIGTVASATAALDPEHRVAVLRLHDEA